MSLLLDTHALLWWSVSPEKLSAPAVEAMRSADELAVCAMTWWEIAWGVRRGGIVPKIPLGSWLQQMSREVRTVPLTPAIAIVAAQLPRDVPSDPGDRLIYATAVEHGWQLVSKDARLRAADTGGNVVIW